ncbi:hypothetical protein QQS21_002652 [Conoideocrella luteorostrata]|uniref:DUF1740-domain-containing protein n=1 Tax=Conoideocrella luteorostrata TaxID=1105319 RepID=A0AAJ0G126_9HYPO|nr:hypothetical protein QQS21_002652 [Conoideocrella luteorostrata]
MADSDNETSFQPAVPKFSSFKAKETSGRTESQGSIARKQERRHSKEAHPSEKRHRSHRHRHDYDDDRQELSQSRRRHEHSSRSRSRKSPELQQQPKSLPERASSSSLFTIDTRGDCLISKYGSIDRAQIPAYYRYGGGRVLGTTGKLVIHRDGARDQFSLRFPGEGLGLSLRDGLRSKSLRFSKESIRLRARARATDADAQDDEDGFLPVGRSRKRKRSQGQSESSDDEGPSYRSIEGKAKTKAFDGESDESSSDEEAVDLQEDNPLKWKSIQLNRRVKEHPGDIDAWLELVNHQDDLQRAGESVDEQNSADAAHSFSEIKVSMLELALDNSSAPEDKLEVLVRLMREGMKIWPAKTAAKKWSELAGEEASNFELWRAHVDFSMTSITIFQYEDIKRMLLERLHRVLARSNSQKMESDYSELLYVFLRAMRFLHDSGYKELAVAAWQAILEINFFRPTLSRNEDIMGSFRDFWESEVPRLGDAEAQGWKQYVETSGQVDAPEPRADSAVQGISTGDAYKAWGHSERCRAEEAKMPARTMDDGTDDDPFRVVMFSDIEPWLFCIPEPEMSGSVGLQLIDAFLIFCGLPPVSRASRWTMLAFRDQFTFRSAPIKTYIKASPLPLNDVGDIQRKPPKFEGSNADMAMSPNLLFSGNSWFQYIGLDFDSLPVDATWAVETVRQLVHLADVKSLALYYLGFSYQKDSTMVKKSAKALLKTYADFAELYNAYALAEFANGHHEIAMKVIASTVESPSLTSGAMGFQLFKSWSWMELINGHKTMATARLCSAVDDSLRQWVPDIEPISPTVVLKARQTVESHIHQSLYDGKANDAGIFVECLALLSYLTDVECVEPTSVAQGNITAAMIIFEKMSAEFKSRGYGEASSHERFLQFGAQLLYFNANMGPFRKTYLRDQLSRFLERFPRNTVFLAVIEWADSSLRVIDETRRLLYDRILIKERDCITSRIFSIQHEMSRGNTNTTQAAFEHALSSDICKFNAGLWGSYIHFCFVNKELRPNAKDVFYRALRHCPWSKEIMIEAFSTLIHDMKSDDLRSVYNTMTSKGLRVHLDLEEWVEDWKKKRERRDRE